ncbi:MAG TPA: hypothetical protein VM098_04275 [Phycisphaerae bacterium]|nr:hypothetical protein [Phycisphaerae bacterium]
MRHIPLLVMMPAIAAGLWASSPPAEPTVDEETAKAFNEFRQEVDKHVERMATRISRRYKLRDEQQEWAHRLISKSAEDFLEDHGQRVFDLVQRGNALREFVKEDQLGWDEVPPDIKQDLAERALPLIDAAEKRMTVFAKSFGESLDPEQQQQFERDQKAMKLGMKVARMRVRMMAGRAPLGRDDSVPPGSSGRGEQREVARTRPADLAASSMDRWERYVNWFVEQYRLDEVQKLRAMDLLSKYKAKAARLARKTERQPATQPATQPSRTDQSMQGFRQRLERLRERRRPVGELFQQLKAELEKIPTAVQRKLAEESRAAAGDRASARSRPSPPARDSRK